MVRSDLAVECMDAADIGIGINKHERTVGGITVVQVTIENAEASMRLKKPRGRYITFNVSDFRSPAVDIIEEAKSVAEILAEFLPQNERGALIVGLGNAEITPDALGPKVVAASFATRHISGELKESVGLAGLTPVAAIAPGVLGKTGIESCEVVRALVQSLNPSFVIAVDALAAKSIDRLGNTIQVSDTGIAPGSGVQNARSALNEETLGVPVIAIGVPMVVDMATIAEDMFNRPLSDGSTQTGMMVTPREVDLCIEHAAKTVAYALNKALQPALSMEELIALAG